MAEMGDDTQKAPYLIVSVIRNLKSGSLILQLRSKNDHIVLYQPYQAPIAASKDSELRFLKLPNPSMPAKRTHKGRRKHPSMARCLRTVQDFYGHDAVFVAGSLSSFILRSASSPPRVYSIAGGPIAHAAMVGGGDYDRCLLMVDYEVGLMDVNQGLADNLERTMPASTICHAASVST